MRLPHLPDPTEGARDAVSGAAHQFAHVAKKVARHIDAAEHRSNQKMHADLQRAHKQGHGDPLRGPLGSAVRGAKKKIR